MHFTHIEIGSTYVTPSFKKNCIEVIFASLSSHFSRAHELHLLVRPLPLCVLFLVIICFCFVLFSRFVFPFGCCFDIANTCVLLFFISTTFSAFLSFGRNGRNDPCVLVLTERLHVVGREDAHLAVWQRTLPPPWVEGWVVGAQDCELDATFKGELVRAPGSVRKL